MQISQSEVDSYLNCRRKHWYAFGEPTAVGRGIEPLHHGQSLTRGNIGHGVLELYYKCIMEGYKHKEAYEEALASLSGLMADANKVQYVIELTPILARYFLTYEDDLREWEPLAIEQEFKFEIPNSELIFPFKVDGIFRHKPSGRMLIWDHKFLWNYYKPKSMMIMPQLAKYAFALEAMGYDISDGMYNMISTRPNSKEPFRRAHLGLGKHQSKKRQFFKEQIQTMQEIVAVKNLEPEKWLERSVRQASSFNCTNCQFLDLCIDDLNQVPGRALTIENFYKPNTYGYGKEEE